jgi:hypothetical protein
MARKELKPAADFDRPQAYRLLSRAIANSRVGKDAAAIKAGDQLQRLMWRARLVSAPAGAA